MSIIDLTERKVLTKNLEFVMLSFIHLTLTEYRNMAKSYRSVEQGQLSVKIKVINDTICFNIINWSLLLSNGYTSIIQVSNGYNSIIQVHLYTTA